MKKKINNYKKKIDYTKKELIKYINKQLMTET